MDETENLQLSPRKLTSLERSRIAVKFVKMNERPEDYLLDNRFLERSQAGTMARQDNLTQYDKKKTQLQSLIEKLSGGYMPPLIKELSKTELGWQLGVCEEHGQYGCQESDCIVQLEESRTAS